MKKRMLRRIVCTIMMAVLSLQVFFGPVTVQAADGYGVEAVQCTLEDVDYAYLAEVTGYTQEQVRGMVKAFSILLSGGASQYDVSALGIARNDSLRGNLVILLEAAGVVQPYEYNATKWMCGSKWYLGSDVVNFVYIEPGETFAEGELAARVQQLKAIVEEIFAAMPSGMGEADCAVWVHDYLIKNYEYDYANLQAGTLPLRAHTAYGLLTDGAGVCDGYTGAYNMILQMCGVECLSITGEAQGSHAWSQIKVEGQWYEADVTWDDPLADVKGKTIYKYLFLTDEQLSQDHTWSGGQVCNSALFSDWFAREVKNMNYYNGFWYYMDSQGRFVRSDILGNQVKILKEDVQAATLYNGRIFYFKDLAMYVENIDGTETVKLMKDTDVELGQSLGNYVAQAVQMNAVKGNVMTYQIRDWHVTETGGGGYSLTSNMLNRTFELPQKYAVPYAAPDRVAGDVNGDGEVNSGDAVALSQYLAEMKVEIVLQNADVNGDGEVNSGDAVVLSQYLAEMNVTLK